MINTEYRKAISEVLDILTHTKKQDVDKISPKFIEFLNKNKSKDYIPKLEHTKRIKDMKLNEKTIGILSIINSKYWCTQEQKELFDNRLKENEKEYQEMLRNKYDSNSIFKNRNKTINIETNVSILEYKESLFSKLVKRIKTFFHKT